MSVFDLSVALPKTAGFTIPRAIWPNGCRMCPFTSFLAFVSITSPQTRHARSGLG